MSEDWTQAWQPTVDVVGQDFSGGIESTAIDEIERATIRRYCEPLEFSCPLHYDEEVARAHGYAGILAPHSGVSSTWIDPGIWRPGEGTRYPLAHQHVDIPRVRGPVMPEPPEAPTTAGFATDIEIEYHQPPVVGDRLTVKGRELMSCLPRETRVGRGAFMIWQRQVVNQRGELVALLRNGGYRYVAFDTPRPSASAPPPAEDDAAEAEEEDLLAIRNVQVGEASPVDWSQQRYFEDVQEGDRYRRSRSTSRSPASSSRRGRTATSTRSTTTARSRSQPARPRCTPTTASSRAGGNAAPASTSAWPVASRRPVPSA